MAAFFSGDSPAAHSIRPSALERTASTASTRDRERDAGPHALSLKVMRISRPALATLERPYFEDVFYPSASLELLDAAGEGSKLSDGERHELQVGGSDRQGISREAGEAMKSLARGELLSNENESLPRSLSHNDGAETSNLAGPSTLRDWPASDMLALPNSFGTIYLGETFSAYLCVNNELGFPIAQPSLRVEMQTGPPPASSSSAGPSNANSGPKTLLAQLGRPSTASSEAAEAGEEASLPPAGRFETTVHHEIKELGPHTLVCTVSYRMPGPDGALYDRSFRKFYKFAVPLCPLSVKTKAHVPRSPSAQLHPDHRVRERVLLEVQVANAGGRPLVFEKLTLEPASGWSWRSVDRPSLKPELSERKSDGKEAEGEDLWQGTQEQLLPGDTRQYLFTLEPTSARPQRPLPPLPLGPGALNSDTVTPSAVASYAGARSSYAAPSNTSASPAATVSVPLGRLDLVWRTGMGELGRLQTSQLVRRRPLIPPVVCLPDAAPADPPRTLSTPRPPSRTEPHSAVAPPPLPKDHAPTTPNPASLTSSRPTSLAPSAAAWATPLLECELTVPVVPRGSARVEESMELTFDLWVRDLSLVRSPPGDDDESDDDRPLSEMRSPRPVASTPKATRTATGKRHVRFLRLAVQHLSLRAQELDSGDAHQTGAPNSPASIRRAEIGAPTPTTPLRDHRDARTPTSAHPAPNAHGLPYAVRNSTDSTRSELSRAFSPPPTASNSPAPYRRSLPPGGVNASPALAMSRVPSISAEGSLSRPGTPSQLGLTRGNSPMPPPPPPKSPQPLPLAPSQANLPSYAPVDSDTSTADTASGLAPAFGTVELGTVSAVLATKARPSLPPPFFDLSRSGPNAGPDAPNPRPGWPSEHVAHLGPSLTLLPPVRVTSGLDEGENGEGEAGDDEAESEGEAHVSFKASYLALEDGLARIGGLRVLVLGWSDGPEAPESSSNPNANASAQHSEGSSRQTNLLRPIILREWDVIAEVWINGLAPDSKTRPIRRASECNASFTGR